MAPAGVLQWVALSERQILVFASLMLFFVWTSRAAMIVAAASGERGLGWHGSSRNRLVYALYVAGTVAITAGTECTPLPAIWEVRVNGECEPVARSIPTRSGSSTLH